MALFTSNLAAQSRVLGAHHPDVLMTAVKLDTILFGQEVTQFVQLSVGTMLAIALGWYSGWLHHPGGLCLVLWLALLHHHGWAGSLGGAGAMLAVAFAYLHNDYAQA